MSRKVQIVLPDPVAAQLEELAVGSHERPSTLAGRMVRDAIARAAEQGQVRQIREAGRRAPSGLGRASWLEPWGGDGRWRQEMWGDIVALRGRYPYALEALQEGWWDHYTHLETLCALAVWRRELDEGGEDPREELFFQAQLAEYAATLRQEGGGIKNAWVPGAPPDGWAGG